MTTTEHKSDFKLTTDTPYLALTGEVWGVYYENFEENWPHYNGTALYHDITHTNTMATAEHETDLAFTKDTQYLALTGKLWDFVRILEK